jgi:hypothetical protein
MWNAGRQHMKKRILVTAFLASLLSGLPINAQQNQVTNLGDIGSDFEDDFNRLDGAVKNGWSPMTGSSNKDLTIRNGYLSSPGGGNNGRAGIYRPLTISPNNAISVTIGEVSGYNGSRNRFDTTLVFGSGGVIGKGFAIQFYRADQSYANSAVNFYLDGLQVGTAKSTIQFSQRISVNLTVTDNGLVNGRVESGNEQFSFSFDPQLSRRLMGDVGIVQGFPDQRAPVITNARVDDFVIKASSVIDYVNGSSAGSIIQPNSLESSGDATTFRSENRCTVEIRVATPEDWLDDNRMKDLVIKHGMELFNERSCLDWKGKPANQVKIYARQIVPIEQKKWDGPCPASISEERRWMCASPMGYVAGSLTGSHLGNFKDTYGAGVTAEIKQQAGATHEFFFGGRTFERISGDVYLVSYDNKALKTKRVAEEFRASDRRRAEAIASKETAALAAKRTHDANVASFRRQASLTLSPKDRGYGSAALEIMIENFFYFNDKAGRRARFKEGKDFLIVQAQYQTLSRADVANGITSIIDVKSVALFKDRSVDPWKEFCSHNRFIRINNGPWKLNSGFSSC